MPLGGDDAPLPTARNTQTAGAHAPAVLLFLWWARMDSNHRPHGYQKWCTRGVRRISDSCNASTSGFVWV